MWNPTIDVAVPGGMAAGVYSATITPLGEVSVPTR
jgi:hypothetical protein